MEKITVLGSCISRVSLLYGNPYDHGIYQGEENGIALEYYLDKHNIALAPLDPPFTDEEVDTILPEMLYDSGRTQSLKQQLKKSTIPMILNGEADWLVMDFYDFHNYIFSYNDTAFGTQSNEFCRTNLHEKYKEQLTGWSLFDVPSWILCGMVDRFFEKISPRIAADHIILNRFRSNTYMLNKEGKIQTISEEWKQPYQCHDKYNDKCRALEEYVIQKYNPWVIDISHYFMGDANVWDNWNGSHFEKEFYRETYTQIMKIVKGKTDCKYYDRVNFFDSNREGYDEDAARIYDVDWNYDVLLYLIKQDDPLWLNVLEQLYIHAPEDERLKPYLEVVLGSVE